MGKVGRGARGWRREVALGGLNPLGGRAGANRLRAALAVVRRRRQPSVLQMWSIYREVRGKIPAILKRCGIRCVFEAKVFEEISFAANVAAGGIVR